MKKVEKSGTGKTLGLQLGRKVKIDVRAADDPGLAERKSVYKDQSESTGLRWSAGLPKKYQTGRMEHFDRVTWNPNQMNGQPCIRGMRLTLRRVVEAVALYPDRNDLLRNYPELEAEDIRQALAFAAASLEDRATESTAA